MVSSGSVRYGEFAAYAKKRKFKTFIIKPESGCQGRGIYLTKNMKEIKPQDRNICQVYLSKPFLLDGFKFDLRVYVLITSCDPLRIYVYNDGLVRFATCRYKEPTNQNTSNVFMHLTNYSVNKHSRMYISDEEAGSKRKISHLNKWLKNHDIDINKLWRKIDEMIVKTILSAYPVLKHSYHTCFSMHNITHACFEILGFDILIDWKMKPFLLEVNHSPSFHTDAPIDKDVKESLLMDTFQLLNFNECDKKKILEEDRQRVRDRLLQGINIKDSSTNDSVDGTKASNEVFREQFKWEDQHMGNFRRIYPCFDDDKYQSFFIQGIASIYQNTLSSKARREEIAKTHREDTINYSKEDGNKKLNSKLDNLKVALESPNEVKKNNPSSLKKNINKFNIPLIPSKKSNTLIEQSKSSLSSSSRNASSLFTPSPINEFEEKERRSSLAERDFIIKNSGIIELIYSAMKKNGSLRPSDIKKYGLYYKLDETLELPESLHDYQKKLYPHNLTGIESDKKRFESMNKEDSNAKNFQLL
ncbi:tubulin polyglutamylase ttll6-like isoform X2 [Chelonus insularis]|uniref:tubulin polyglutamylase ttll6-like isoform X2 n=1 Tax=Chelonus insularis TaxID=460826 RepID=UPI00158A176E|nr:tubulin polyglutamylase ttll6-like isoform X2 [Chelonus insularis]